MNSDSGTEASDLRKKAEEQIKKRKTKTPLIQSESEKAILIHELEVHQIELMMQNDELLLTKESLETALEKYTELYDTAPTGYLTLSEDASIIEINICASKMIGKDRHNLINANFGFFVTEQSRRALMSFIDQIIKEGKNETCELALLTASGKIEFVYVIGHASAANNQCNISMVDITERKRSEETLKKYLDELTAANKEIELRIEEKNVNAARLLESNLQLEQALNMNSDKNRLISVLAHDLRTPFSIILGYSDLLIEKINEFNTDEIINLAAEIRKSTQNTFNLLEDLLKWAKLQSGNIPFKPQPLSFSDLCKNIIDLLTPQLEAKNIKIKYSAAQDVDIVADPEMIKTVVRNLISNAIKFTNRYGEIGIYAEQTDSNFLFSITDNGTGIKPERISGLFNHSLAQDTDGTEGEKGTGLGLFICKGIIEKHGGRIWAESIYNKGSIFYFTLPRTSGNKETLTRFISKDENRVKDLKILIADDNLALRLILGEIAKKYSREILFAGNGNEAVTLYKTNPDIDLILMDFFMPDMNGYEAIKQIRLINQGVKIFVETADTLSNIEKEFEGVEIDDFFPKPYSKFYFNQLMLKHFDKRKITEKNTD